MYKISFLLFLTLILIFSNIQAQEKEEFYPQYTSQIGYGHKKKKNPEFFQGNKEKKNYFEGWYFKMVSVDESSIISIIPGVSLSENGEDKHAFIQIIDGKTATTSYYTFPIESFNFSKGRFAVHIGDNFFSEDSIILNLKNDTNTIIGSVYMYEQIKLTKNNKRKKKQGIMGWYKRIPFMQCYHGVVSLDHKLTGNLIINNANHKFDQGVGYIEKDWGTSMPSAWIWIQSNSFSTEKTSFMLSIADVPWIGKSFPGFLGFFLHDDKVYQFGTYSGAKFEIENSDQNTVIITIKDKKYTYKIETYREQSGLLKAPFKGSMDRRIAESVDASLSIIIIDKKGNLVFEDNSKVAGLEIVGDMKELKK